MRIFLDNKYYDQISLNIGKYNHVIAPNGKGKTTFMNSLKSAFEGKE